MTAPHRPRTLLLLRHGKSSWDDPGLHDFDRPLAPRGRRDAPRMAAWLREQGWRPDIVLCSPAVRTRETWAAVADALPEPEEVRYPQSLYHAAPAAILELVRGLPEGAATALVVGHNPGLAEVAATLADGAVRAEGVEGTASEKELRRLRKKVPTAALAVFRVDGRWSDVGSGRVRLERFVRPKDLRD